MAGVASRNERHTARSSVASVTGESTAHGVSMHVELTSDLWISSYRLFREYGQSPRIENLSLTHAARQAGRRSERRRAGLGDEDAYIAAVEKSVCCTLHRRCAFSWRRVRETTCSDRLGVHRRAGRVREVASCCSGPVMSETHHFFPWACWQLSRASRLA